MTSETSRRAVLAGAAAIPALSLPAIASADPIFAVIKRHQQLETVYIAAGEAISTKADEDRADELGNKSWEQYAKLVAKTPATVAGCAALLRYIEQHESTRTRAALFDNCNEQVRGPGKTLLSRVADVLAGQAVES